MASVAVFIPGGNGFVGQSVCRCLDQQGVQYLSNSQRDGIDYRNLDELRSVFSAHQIDYVVNCAAFVGGIQYGFDHPGRMFYDNILIMLNFLECCREFGIKRLVNPIANCAYPGDASTYRVEAFWDGPLHESVLAYGFARKASAVGGWAYSREYGLDCSNIILPNMYGPRDHFEPARSHALGALVMRIVDATARDEPAVTVWGSGKPIREWLYVEDGAEALVRAIWAPRITDPVNVGVSKGISIGDLAALIGEIVGYRGSLVFDETKPDGAPVKVMDGSSGAQLLGWEPSTSLRDGIARTVEWYRRSSGGNSREGA